MTKNASTFCSESRTLDAAQTEHAEQAAPTELSELSELTEKRGSPYVDAVASQRWARRAPHTTPWLHQEVGRRMGERLDWITTPVERWAHWNAVRGGWEQHAQIQQSLQSRFAAVRSYVLETQAHHAAWAKEQLQVQNRFAIESTTRHSFLKWWERAKPSKVNVPNVLSACDEDALNLLKHAAQMLWSNMALHLDADPLQTLSRWSDVLAPGGYLLFSCLGPDTLCELRRRYQDRGWGAPTHAMTDMHDWGDALQAAGFAEPIVDMERIVLTYSNVDAMLAELRALGRNLSPARGALFKGLRGRRWLGELKEMLEMDKQMTFEVIYGHAFKPEQSRDKATGEVKIGLDSLRRQLKLSRR